jgi:hypothetical protein
MRLRCGNENPKRLFSRWPPPTASAPPRKSAAFRNLRFKEIHFLALTDQPSCPPRRGSDRFNNARPQNKARIVACVDSFVPCARPMAHDAGAISLRRARPGGRRDNNQAGSGGVEVVSREVASRGRIGLRQSQRSQRGDESGQENRGEFIASLCHDGSNGSKGRADFPADSRWRLRRFSLGACGLRGGAVSGISGSCPTAPASGP